MILKSRIKLLREKEGRTNKWIANQMGVSQETVSRWANDKVFPSVIALFMLAEILNCKVDDLYEKDR